MAIYGFCVGVIGTALDFVSHGSELSPAFYLVNQGYDVWLSNTRGSRFSRNHTTLNPSYDDEYWRFTVTEQAYDVRTNIEYILNQTGADVLSYIGFSQGGGIGFAALSLDNEWFASRVSVYIAMAPIVHTQHMTSPFFLSVASNRFILRFLRKMGVEDLAPSSTSNQLMVGTICRFFTQL